MSFALPPWLPLGQRLPEPCAEGNGSFVPSGAGLAVQSHNSFGRSLQAVVAAGKGSRCARAELVLQPLETAGSAGVASALPISDPLAQIAPGNAALSLLLRLKTHSFQQLMGRGGGDSLDCRILIPKLFQTERVGRPLQKPSPTCSPSPTGDCSSMLGPADPSSRQSVPWAGTGTTASGCRLFLVHSGSGVASPRNWTGNPQSLCV